MTTSIDVLSVLLEDLSSSSPENQASLTRFLEVIDDAFQNDQFDIIEQIYAKLKQRYEQYHQMANQHQFPMSSIVSKLARIPSQSGLDMLLQIVAKGMIDAPLYNLASKVAAAHPLDKLYELFQKQIAEKDIEGAIFVEIFLCIIAQEILLLRAVDIEQNEIIKQFLDGVQHHEAFDIQQMLWLPRTLMPVEQAVQAKLPRIKISEYGNMSFGVTRRNLFLETDKDQTDISKRSIIISTRECTQAFIYKNIIEPIQKWHRFTAHVFEFNVPLEAKTLSPNVLSQLGAECFEDSDHIALKAITLNGAYLDLFQTSLGPIPEMQFASGRYRTWKALGGLSGAPSDASVEEINTLCNECWWFGFNADGKWFYDNSLDIGLIALRPDGKSLALLAATATD